MKRVSADIRDYAMAMRLLTAHGKAALAQAEALGAAPEVIAIVRVHLERQRVGVVPRRAAEND